MIILKAHTPKIWTFDPIFGIDVHMVINDRLLPLQKVDRNDTI